MNVFATITGQGQLTIPAKFRRRLGFTVPTKVVIREEENRLVIEGVPDIFSGKGMFANRAMKGMSMEKIIEREEKAGYEFAKKKYASRT